MTAFTPEFRREVERHAKAMRRRGVPYRAVARELDISLHAAWRAAPEVRLFRIVTRVLVDGTVRVIRV